MGKKKGGGKKSGKKKGGKKGKKGKNAEPQMTWKEALLAYQINLKEKALEDVRYEIRALEETKQRHNERNERLREEQQHYITLLLKQAKEFEHQLSLEDTVKKDQVVTVMMDKWQSGREEDKSIADLKEQIARIEAEIVAEQQQRTYWHGFRDKGKDDQSLQIKLLEQELVDMQTSFDEMAGHLERTLLQAKDEVDKHTEDTLDKQKYYASEKAMAKMDKYSRQEVLDNDWLKKEVEIHRREVHGLLKEVEEVENSNVEIMAQLFECTVDDLKVSRNFYLTQFEGEENLDIDGILEMDLSKLSIVDRLADKSPPLAIENGDKSSEKTERPKSARLKAIEEKVMSMEAREEQGEEGEESDFDGDNGLEDSEDEDPFNNYFHFDDEDFDDYLKLGPLELKLLNIKGEKMAIHTQAPLPTEEVKAKSFKPDEWPVTQPMLRHTVFTPATAASRR